MKIRLDQIQDEPFLWRETLSFSRGDIDRSELSGLGEIECRGRLSRIEHGLLLEARVAYEQELVCDRCLDTFTEPVVAELGLMVSQEPAVAVAGEREMEERELGMLYVKGEVLDTVPLVEEQIQLNIPMKPLCRDDCKGLCPTCGADWNAGRCECSQETIDPRWSKLALLKQRFEEEEPSG